MIGKRRRRREGDDEEGERKRPAMVVRGGDREMHAAFMPFVIRWFSF